MARPGYRNHPAEPKDPPARVATALGLLRVYFSPAGIFAIDFAGRSAFAGAGSNSALPESWQRAITLAAAGRPFAPVPLSLVGTDFQLRVWAALEEIPHGQTETYGSIAAHLGLPRAARAVGAACGANPVPLLVPCHRVVAAGGHIGGFSGGLEIKRFLLEREQEDRLAWSE